MSAAIFDNFWRALDTFWDLVDADFTIRPNPFDRLVSVFSASTMTSSSTNNSISATRRH